MVCHKTEVEETSIKLPNDCFIRVMTVILEYFEHILAYFGVVLPLHFQSWGALAPPSATTVKFLTS